MCDCEKTVTTSALFLVFRSKHLALIIVVFFVPQCALHQFFQKFFRKFLDTPTNRKLFLWQI